MDRCRIARALFPVLLALPALLTEATSQVPAATTAPSAKPIQDPSAGMFTLHVYANLIQVPTLVLNSDRKPIPAIPREKFDVTLDGGTPFHPTQMRMEGDDPISLAILLDASGDQPELVKAFGSSFAALAPEYLRPRDHVSIYAVDCGLFRSANDIPADPTALKAGFDKVLLAPGLHGKKLKPACSSSMHLWDSLTKISDQLAELAGRRVILVVSEGDDGRSITSREDASLLISTRGVSVFSIRNKTEYDRDHLLLQVARTGNFGDGHSEDHLDTLCQKNGGYTFNTSESQLNKSLQDFVAMLRSRYIVEFPRPDDSQPGRHQIAITVPGTPAYIRTTGVTTPLPDPALLADPNTVRSKPSPATYGTRRPQD